MATIESTGTSNEIKEQYEKNEKFVRRVFYFPLFPKRKIKAKEDRNDVVRWEKKWKWE